MRKLLFGIVGFCVALLVGLFAYRYMQLTAEVARLKMSPVDQAKREIEQLVGEVKKLIAVPSEELPTVATVSDPEKLKANIFFANAQAGDKVLIYTQAKKAILYRPQEHKVIEIAPLSIGSSSATVAPQKILIVLYNGTHVVGLTKTYETTVKKMIPTAVIVDRDNAKNGEYKKSVLIDISGKKSTQANELASVLDIEVAALPEGETKPEGADFLIIIGSDKQ